MTPFRNPCRARRAAAGLCPECGGATDRAPLRCSACCEVARVKERARRALRRSVLLCPRCSSRTHAGPGNCRPCKREVNAYRRLLRARRAAA